MKKLKKKYNVSFYSSIKRLETIFKPQKKKIKNNNKIFLQIILGGILSLNIFFILPIIHYSKLSEMELYYIEKFVPPLIKKEMKNQKKWEKFSPLRIINYQAQAGDTFWSISKKIGVRLDTILSYNHIKKTHHLLPSTVLKVPLQDGILHKKEKNKEIDFAELARKYNIAADKIRYYNQKNNEKYLFIPDATFSLSERLNLYGKEFFSPLINLTRITSFFGFRIHPLTKKRSRHHGIDLACNHGSTVHATKGGVVKKAYSTSGYGKSVIIAHDKNTFTRYAHLSKIGVRNGEKVYTGKVIGRCGSSGNVTGPHLHFEIIRSGKLINPLYLTEIKKK